MTEQEARRILEKELAIENGALKIACERAGVPIISYFSSNVYNGNLRGSNDGITYYPIERDEDEIYFEVWGPAESEKEAQEKNNGTLYAVSRTEKRAYSPEY